MKDSIDPRLVDQITAADDDCEVEAVLMLRRQAGASDDERGAGGPVMDRVVKRLNETPARVKFHPRLNTVFVRGSARFLRELLEESEVSSASATDYDASLKYRRDDAT